MLSCRELEAQELQAQLDEVSQASSAQQAADAAALAAQRAALSAAAAVEEARLRREVQVWNGFDLAQRDLRLVWAEVCFSVKAPA